MSGASPPPASAGSPPPPPKPRLKINVSRSSSFVADAKPTPSSEAPRKVKLKIGPSQPSTPAEPPAPVKTKAGRQPKPTQKLVESKKRPHDDLDDEPLSAAAHAATRIKIKPTKAGMTPTLVVKPKGRIPVHPPGDGYDSEASDRERDPAIEEQFVMRLPEGEHCDYVRHCMENGKMGVARGMGGADIQLKWFEEETRRAMLTIKGQPFAAVLVDLPTITESMKTWDRKSFLKSADICQLLLVYQKVNNEAEARTVPIPSMIDSHFRWPHGLTPPMHDCVNRRFAKTISRKEIENKEAEVERLLAEDAKAASTKWEWVDDRQPEADDEDEDAEGELDDTMDYFQSQDVFGEEDNDLEADLEAAFADDVAETPATGAEASTPMTTTQVNTPAIQSIESDESEEVSDDDDDDDDDDEDLDDDERAQRDEEQGVKDIIKDLEKQLATRQADLGRTTNKILRGRLETQIKQLKSEIELKMSSIGIETDD